MHVRSAERPLSAQHGRPGPRPFRGRRCLIIGGRQSAYELATLLERHAGADITIVHRHDAPAFQESDWSWVADQIRRAEQNPGWFAQLEKAEQEAIRQRFWSEGRLKLEPWLGERLRDSTIVVMANTTIAGIVQDGDQLTVRLSDGTALRHVDVVILATGFKVDLRRIPYLDPALVAAVRCADGYPVLDDTFQSASVAGLAFAGMVAARDFGPYLGFLASCPFAARRAVAGIEARLRGDTPHTPRVMASA